LKDELVLVCKGLTVSKQRRNHKEDFLQLRFFEAGSGTLEVIEHALKPLKIKMSELIVEMQLGSTRVLSLI
jgi:hypothetical protein